ncbi:hypothetical protein B0H12DRAFT_1228997 [Mycena haematopus]|nr:hypothetical protein B0H12DRAFT_1228997 [Mycena haematopus]
MLAAWTYFSVLNITHSTYSEGRWVWRTRTIFAPLILKSAPASRSLAPLPVLEHGHPALRPAQSLRQLCLAERQQQLVLCRVSPYRHLYDCTCIPCRINAPRTSHGLGAALPRRVVPAPRHRHPLQRTRGPASVVAARADALGGADDGAGGARGPPPSRVHALLSHG